ncbi:hypothetical protein HRR83_005285 [Exophiala dermatitidis]|uniref:Kinetochore protein fta4 n=3 Tax=Exophiala dermatitidis TaxID=5970 RepID=H6C1S4_EXODN|nr:uncharacterized protein HMPREF1120_05827 [Exophiala dermatitidis NIH/UT8656]KAJ4512944.1 hypothetical protein HRR75_004711 [Exophiala dermatitidis]EHY57803.1 hypothetical protein HMPREF1120_05827 [Exophiala dermatitidis NIH/UT8656]KAJ4515980.1 hypothetical protein HRR74_005137 [Exophiala dermatitidis]KAJ4518614.1 hypothetical protein HRR73_004195 [Exophiala dermatitidis]KAJ4534125.1 hypothetical protein HRR76_006061 [Exophiala dermatitidis]
MDEPGQSITAIKAAFIRSQVRQLCAPLEASPDWNGSNRVQTAKGDHGRPGHLSDKAVQDIVAKVNDEIRKHNRMVYSAQSQRHVAEQIETLYWNIISAECDDADTNTNATTVVAPRDADLTESHTTIKSLLPEQYTDLHLHPQHDPHSGHGHEAEAYTTLREDLIEMARKRDALRQNLARYRHLQSLLEPLDDPQTNIQPNLVTRDGELGKELDRMRILLARVTGRVGEMKNLNATTLDRRDTTATGTDTNLSQSITPTTTAQTDQQKLALLMDLT